MKYIFGSEEQPMILKTPTLSSEYSLYTDIKKGKEILVCKIGRSILYYDYRCIDDLYNMLKKNGDWMVLGSVIERRVPKKKTVEAWGRSENNPIGGWYGLKKGFRGRFSTYIPPILEVLGLAEVTHEAKNNKMRAI
jgi:hypothetical protein